MSCIICGTHLNKGQARFDTTIRRRASKGEESDYVRSKEKHPMCRDCYNRGDYKSMACKVIYHAIDEFCFPKTENKRTINNVMAYQSNARWFLFGSEDVKMWAGMANFPVDNIRKYVRGILDDIKAGNGQARREEIEKCLS